MSSSSGPPVATTPRGPATPRRKVKKQTKDENKAPVNPEQAAQDEMETASASMLFAELMIGTPRGQQHVEKAREMLKRPLPDTIQPPSIVVQHSEQMAAPELTPSKRLVQRYDYLTPAEMANEMNRVDLNANANAEQEVTSSPPAAAAAGPQAFQVVADEDPVEEEVGDGRPWIPEVLLQRRRIRADATSDGSMGEWQYLVRWVGRPETEDAWVPESALDPAFIDADMRALETERQLTARARQAAQEPA